MNKILLLICLMAFSFVTMGQTDPTQNTQWQGNANNLLVTRGILKADSGFVNARFADTASANLNSYLKYYAGSQIFTTSDNALWIRNISATRWLFVGNGTGSSTNTCAGLLSGGVVTWNSLLEFDVSAAIYCITNNTYNSASGTITLDAADPSLPRIDVIGVDTLGQIFKITGTPAADPAVPQVDPASQLYLTNVLVGAGATTPTGVSQVVLWNENIGSPEYVGSNTGAVTNFDNTLNPYVGIKATDVGAWSSTGLKVSVTYSGTAYSTTTYNTLKFFIRLKSTLATTANIYVTLRSGGVAVTSPLLLSSLQGLNKSLTGVYQNISIPFTDFASTSFPSTIDGVRITTTGSNTSGFYLDYMTLNGGVTTGNTNYLTDVFASNDSLYKVKNGITTFWYKVTGGGASTDTTKAGFPLYVRTKAETGSLYDSLKIAYGDSIIIGGHITGSNIVLEKIDGDSVVVALPSGITTATLSDSLDNYIPRAGTRPGKEVTGDVEIVTGYGETRIYKNHVDEDAKMRIAFGENVVQIVNENYAGTQLAGLTVSRDEVVINGNSTNRGISGNTYFTDKSNPNTYAQMQDIADSAATKQNLITLTTTGTSGAATFNQGTGALNIPSYSGGGSSSTVTENKNYYNQEFYWNKGFNTATGAFTNDITSDITDYLPIEGSTSVTISTTDSSLITVYGWTYDSSLTAISAIRSFALVGTKLKTYTFTTPSNARYMAIYTKAASDTFNNRLRIYSTDQVTYNVPLVPESYTGTDQQKIQQALNFGRWVTAPVELKGTYYLDSSLIVNSGNTLLLNGAKVRMNYGMHDNMIRNEAVAQPSVYKFNRGNKNIKIIGLGGAEFIGSTEQWGGDTQTVVRNEKWRLKKINLANVENFELSGFKIRASHQWGIVLEQSRIGTIKNIEILEAKERPNQSGVQLHRGSHGVTIDDIRGINLEDDIIAIENILYNAETYIYGTVIQEPYKTNLDIYDVFISNINKGFTNITATYALPFPFKAYSSSIRILTADSLKIHDLHLTNVNGIQQVMIQDPSTTYYTTAAPTVNDVYNIYMDNVNAPIYIFMPIKNSSFTDVPPLDATGTYNAVKPPNGSLAIYRRYNNAPAQFIGSVTAGVENVSMAPGTFNGNIIVSGNATVASGSSLLMPQTTGTNRSFALTNTNVTDNFASGNFYPSAGTNVSMTMSVMPRGTGRTSTEKSQMTFYNTDFIADATNYEFGKFKAAGTDGYGIMSAAAGTGTVRPVFIDASGSQSLATANMTFKINGGILFPATNTTTGTTGAQTINKTSGKVNFAAAATTLVVTNSLVTTASIVMVTVEGADATATSARVTLAAGRFTITLNAAATAETKVSFFVIN